MGASEVMAILLLPASEDRLPLFEYDLWLKSGIELVWIDAFGPEPLTGFSD